MKGKAPTHVDPNYIDSKHPLIQNDASECRGMRFKLLIKALSKDGIITADTN